MFILGRSSPFTPSSPSRVLRTTPGDTKVSDVFVTSAMTSDLGVCIHPERENYGVRRVTRQVSTDPFPDVRPFETSQYHPEKGYQLHHSHHPPFTWKIEDGFYRSFYCRTDAPDPVNDQHIEIHQVKSTKFPLSTSVQIVERVLFRVTESEPRDGRHRGKETGETDVPTILR